MEFDAKMKFQVCIAGAGPVGLFLACELGMAGVSTLVIESKPDQSDPWRDGVLGYRGLSNLSSEIFYRRGLLHKVMTKPITAASLSLPDDEKHDAPGEGAFAGHFAGIVIDSRNVDWTKWKHILPGPSAFGGALQLGQLVDTLYQRAKALGVTILHNHPLTRFEDTESGVKIWTGSTILGGTDSNNTTGDHHRGAFEPATAQEAVFTAEYLIGADGGRSYVRKHGNFTFSGSEATMVGYIADCDMSEETKDLLKPGFQHTPQGVFVARPPYSPTTHFLLDFDAQVDERARSSVAHRAIVTREKFEDVIRRVSGEHRLVVDSLRIAGSFTDRAKVVTQYRRGRILLVGDAAHIHAPLGGQGLNLGLGDAMNLGWKLASVVKGSAKEKLLDTYFDERHPVALEVLEATRAQTAALRPGLHGQAIYNLAKDLINTRDGSTLFASKFMWYNPRIDFGEGAHWLAGYTAPDFKFVDGSRLGSKMESGNWVVVDFSKSEELSVFAKDSDWLYVGDDAAQTLGLKVVLVRPDGVVAWATDTEDSETTLKNLKEARLE